MDHGMLLWTLLLWTTACYYGLFAAVRGQGGYYMFQDVSDEELSDLEPDAIPGGEDEEGKHTAFHVSSLYGSGLVCVKGHG